MTLPPLRRRKDISRSPDGIPVVSSLLHFRGLRRCSLEPPTFLPLHSRPILTRVSLLLLKIYHAQGFPTRGSVCSATVASLLTILVRPFLVSSLFVLPRSLTSPRASTQLFKSQPLASQTLDMDQDLEPSARMDEEARLQFDIDQLLLLPDDLFLLAM